MLIRIRWLLFQDDKYDARENHIVKRCHLPSLMKIHTNFHAMITMTRSLIERFTISDSDRSKSKKKKRRSDKSRQKSLSPLSKRMALMSGAGEMVDAADGNLNLSQVFGAEGNDYELRVSCQRKRHLADVNSKIFHVRSTSSWI